ncbi:hypothetical protein [Streptomyces sp. SCSIO ZS0520]|uniref:hypothetical protein n=1 Tax=Streptomyces sp. SCSIO ZS0520 TaxID=2892996 RepID=UPI0039864526
MPGECVPPEPREPQKPQNPPGLPALGALLVDARGRIGEFRGEWCGLWSLRPIGGGIEWTVEPTQVQRATRGQELRARTAYANARSRGERL